MKLAHMITSAFILLTSISAQASTVDIVGGSDASTQSIVHCGFLPATAAKRYTTLPLITEIIQKKLTLLGLYHGPLDGVYGPASQRAVRAFQSDANLQVDGIVGPITASMLAYQTHPNSNVRRCYRAAPPLFR